MKREAHEPYEILIVEDNPADVALIELLFTEAKAPAKLHVARDGQEASDFVFRRGAFSQAPVPDLILVDRNVPIKNGIELLKAFKENPEQRRIPVIFLTTSSNRPEIEEAYRLGANAFIPKPLDLETYQRAIINLCRFWFECAHLTTRQHVAN